MRLASYVPGELIPLPLSGSTPELPHVEKVLLGRRARIFRVADAFHAWRHERPYRFILNRPRTFVIDVVVDLAGLVNQSVRTERASGPVVLLGVLAGGRTDFDLGPAVTREILLEGNTVGSEAMFEDMLKAMTLNRILPTIEIAPRGFDEAQQVIRALE